MAIETRSAFIYGFNINENNEIINFSEDGGTTELTATVKNSSYYMNNFGDAVARALNEIGDNEYTITLDRNARKFTISADANFDLLVTTGSQALISVFSLMGFTSDKTGSDSYESDTAAGSVYEPQAPLRDYVPFENSYEPMQHKLNESSDGNTLELVRYGLKEFMSCNIKYATNINMIKSDYIENNPNGVSDLRDFMLEAITKRPIEFVEDKADYDVFTPCILESSQGSRDGVKFELRELYSEGLAFYFESGTLRFRKIS